MAAYDSLFPGDLAPWFRQRCTVPPDGRTGTYSFDMAAGRHVVLCFYGSAAEPQATYALAALQAHSGLFEAASVTCFGLSVDEDDERSGRAVTAAPSIRHIWDHDLSVARRYGVAPAGGAGDLRRAWYVLDRRLRIKAVVPFTAAGADEVLRIIASLADTARQQPAAQVPVLVVPGVFESEFCARLIDIFLADGGTASGVFTESRAGSGTTVADAAVKRRRDLRLIDSALINQSQTRIFRRVVPELRHAFQFQATRLERLIIACYDAADGGHFAPHRDNTMDTTAHRRFAVSINLNDDFDGGGISFPEYSERDFKPPTGAALVFSCTMLHAVSPMRRGRRFACLPFVYDEAAAHECAKRQPGLGGAKS